MQHVVANAKKYPGEFWFCTLLTLFINILVWFALIVSKGFHWLPIVFGFGGTAFLYWGWRNLGFTRKNRF